MVRLFKFWRLGGKDLRLLWFALRQPNRPVWLLPVAAALAFYALEPANFALPLVGIVDDFFILPLILHWLVKFLPPDIHRNFGGIARRR